MGNYVAYDDSPPVEEQSETKDDFLERYTLGKQLGKGSQGVVHVCYDRQTGDSRAVKILERSNKTAWSTYKREVELTQAASGRNIATVLEEFVDAGRCYVLMERFEGHLRKALKVTQKENSEDIGTGLDQSSLANVIRQALSAILHMHTCGMVHRDVKAHNLLTDRVDLTDPRCRVVLSDFGLARRLEPGRFLCAQVGTRKYWAPELYEKRYWHVVDVFAVGVLMYLASMTVYPYQDEEQTRNRDVFALDEIPPEIPADMLSFLRKALEKDPNNRPSAAELGQHPWLKNAGGIIQQVDEKTLRAAQVVRGPCAIVGSRRFGPKISQLPACVGELRGDRAEDLEPGCLEPGVYKEPRDDSDGSTVFPQHSPLSDASHPRSAGISGLTRSFFSAKAPIPKQ